MQSVLLRNIAFIRVTEKNKVFPKHRALMAKQTLQSITISKSATRVLIKTIREASHQLCPQETSILRFSRDPPPPWNVKSLATIAFSRFWYLSYSIPLPLAAIKIVSKHKVVCTKFHFWSQTTYYINYIFCEKQKELADEFKTKGILYFISLSKMFAKSPNFF